MKTAPKKTSRPFTGFDSSTVTSGAAMTATVLGAYKCDDVTPEERARAVEILANHGTLVRRLPVSPRCQLCQSPIGVEVVSISGGRYEWLRGSEHYLTAHNLWPPLLRGLLLHVELNAPRPSFP